MLFAKLLLSLLLIITPFALLAHDDDQEHAVIIHFSLEGYSPDVLEVPVGTTVVFENISDQDFWPASDDHPSHTVYDGTSLDEHCKDGIFDFHDHLWPHLDGVITVYDFNESTKELPGFTELKQEVKKLPFFASVQQLFRNFYAWLFGSSPKKTYVGPLLTGDTQDGYYVELQQQFVDLVNLQDPKIAIETLQMLGETDTRALALCHDVLHEIGKAAFIKYGNFQTAVEFQSDFCNSGYIHGLFEQYFKVTENPFAALSQQCEQYAAGKRPFDLWQCHHGIGHGFMYLNGGDLDTSLQHCEDGLDGSAVDSCQNGAYMELFNQEILAKEFNYLYPDDPFKPCKDRVDNKGDCYLYVPTYLSQTLNIAYQDMFDVCANAERNYRSTCIAGVGSEAFKRNMRNVETLVELCLSANTTLEQNSCMGGVISMSMNQAGSYQAGEQLCNELPERFDAVCVAKLNGKKNFFE
jgi:hypothetical protein